MTPAEEFTARLLDKLWADDCNSMEGYDIEVMAVETGLAVERRVTQEDIDNSDAMQEWDMVPGDLWAFATPELLALMSQLK